MPEALRPADADVQALLEFHELLEQVQEQMRANPPLFWHVEAPRHPVTGRPAWPNAHPKQLAFHRSQAYSRWAMGGNQSGKTELVVRELCYWLSHQHPFRETPRRALKIRHYALDYLKVEEILIPAYRAALPPGIIDSKRGRDGYNGEKHILYVRCPYDTLDHEVHFSTYEQDAKKAEGGQFDVIAYDEPPPKMLWEANKVRMLKRDGQEMGALTPLEEQFNYDVSWIFHDIVAKADGRKVETWQMATEENLPNLGALVYADLVAGMTEEQKDVRLKGHFAFLKGLVYKEFDQKYHVCKPFDWRSRVALGKGVVYCGLDHGHNNPTAVLWHYVEGEGDDARAWIVQEYLQAGLTVEDNCANVLEMNGEEPVELWLADPSIWNDSPVTGLPLADEYHRCGVPINPGDNSIPRGHAVCGRWMKVPRNKRGETWRENPQVPTPRLMVFDTCTETIAAIRSYTWKPSGSRWGGARPEKPGEKHKHIPDAMRYVLTFGPEGVPMQAPPMRACDPKTGTPYAIDIEGAQKRQTRLEREGAVLTMPEADDLTVAERSARAIDAAEKLLAGVA